MIQLSEHARARARADSHAHLPELRHLVNNVETLMLLHVFASRGFWLAVTWCSSKQGVSSHRKRTRVNNDWWTNSQSLNIVHSMGQDSRRGLWPTDLCTFCLLGWVAQAVLVRVWSRSGDRMSLLVRVIVVGAGSRGENYARYASVHPERMTVRCSWRFLEGKRALWSNDDVNINITIQMNWSISLQVQFIVAHTI